MFVWFVATAVLTVYFVFDSPALDYRFVALGSVLPLVETVTGSPWILHTLVGSVGALAVVMGLTIGRRIRRRRLLGIPIGTFLFLVFSGTWTQTGLFWWPMAGLDAIGTGVPPEFDRPLPLLLVLEAIGIGALGWLWTSRDIGRPETRTRLLRTGRLPT